ADGRLAAVEVVTEANLHAPPPGRDLYVVAPGTISGPSGDRELAALRRRVAPGLVAGPSAPDGPYDRWRADALVIEPGPDAEATAWAALAAGVRAAGRPVVVLARRPVDPDSLTAAIDAGAAGVVVATGDEARDAELLDEAARREDQRLDDAPLLTVAICNRNGAEDLEECLGSLPALRYPRWEALVLDDGSTDDSVAVARRHGARVVELGSVGLGVARNAAIDHARGEIIAYLDGDAAATPGWAARLWRLHDRLRPGGVGGPNLAFDDPNWQERAVGGAPGVAMPIVGADGRCTHIAGCNMSFRADIAREARFDPGVGIGDDLEFCFRVLDRGHDILLAPTGIVLHHRRRSLKRYVKQMHLYGRWSGLIIKRHGERLTTMDTDASLLSRLDPRRRRICFVGPQASQRYNLSFAPLSNGFPLKVLLATLGASALAAPGAIATGHGRPWRRATALAIGAQVGYVVARTPVQSPGPGPRAVANRLVTAALWYAGPAAVSMGRMNPMPDDGPA
ncbi:MAG TPA: glycosyltransferase, partial [Capillimicrobium sp.]